MRKLIFATLALSLSVCLLSCTEGQARRGMAGDSFASAAVDPSDAPNPPTRRVWAEALDGGTVSPLEPILAFVDWTTGGDVAIHDLGTGQDRRITDIQGDDHPYGWAESPLYFSPNGEEIVYSFGNTEPGLDPYRYQLRAVRRDGSENRALWQAETLQGFISPRAWSRDHGILVSLCTEELPDCGMALLDPENGDVQVLRKFNDGGPWTEEASFSPDESLLLYREGPRLRMRAMETGTDRDLGLEASSILGWAPDGSGFLIHAHRQGVSGFWLVPVNGGGSAGAPELIRGGVPTAWGKGRNGDSFYYSVLVEGPQVFQTSVDMDAGRMLSAPTALTPITNRKVAWPTWSPDGRHMAYGVQDMDGTTDLHLRSADGEEITALADLGRTREFMYLTWSSDGAALYYMTYFEDQRYLNRTDIRTGITDTLLVEPPDEAPKAALITPDGTRAVLSRSYPQGPEDMPRGLVVRDLETGAETVLSPDAPLSMGMSPDGSVLSVLVDDLDLKVRRLLLQPLDGGPATVLAEFDGSKGGINRISGLDWTPDGRFIMTTCFIPAGEGEWDLQYITAFPVDGGDPVRLGQISTPWAKPSLHPDGRRLIYVDGEEKAEIWVMEGWE